MKISKAIVATDNNPLYTECWPLITKGWRNLGNVETVIATIGACDIDEALGQVLYFEPIEGIPNGFISQVIRFIIPAFFPEEVCITSDIDMLTLSKQYFVDSLKHFSDESLLVLSSDAYGVDDKFPMCYFVAKGKIFQKLIGLRDTERETINNFIIDLYKMDLGWITDEVFLGKCIKEKKNNFDVHFLERCKSNPFQKTRIDRSSWGINKISLLTNKYIDSHLLRPLSQYKDEVALLELYVKYKNNAIRALLAQFRNNFFKIFVK